MEYVLDTNVILRFLVGDHLEQQKQAEQWFKDAEAGKYTISIHPLVVAESCFVLESIYKKSRNEIATAMEVFLSQRWLRIVERETLVQMWDHYRSGLHFVDSFLLALAAENKGKLLSFDQKAVRKGRK